MGQILLILALIFQVSPDKELLEIRNQFHLATTDEKAANLLQNTLSKIDNKTPIEQGYDGATKMIVAKYAILPTQKYSCYVIGKSLLEQAIIKDSVNIELIYLRFIIQTKSPAFLGYTKNLSQDRINLIENTKTLTDKDLKIKISTFLVLEGQLSEAERKKLQ